MARQRISEARHDARTGSPQRNWQTWEKEKHVLAMWRASCFSCCFSCFSRFQGLLSHGHRSLSFQIVFSSSFCIFSMACSRTHEKKKAIVMRRLEGHEFGRTSLYNWCDGSHEGASGCIFLLFFLRFAPSCH
ncbi:hypothetical protein J3F83DRAFT_756129 [Trichoderma novae-zelandiae]